MRWVLIVNGPPGSGKTTLATALARDLGLPLLSKDAVKEALLDELGYDDRADSRRIGAASGEVLWTVLRDCPTAAVIDSWLAPSNREVVRRGLARASIDTVVELWCDCPADETTRRYAARHRHPGHFDRDLVHELADVLARAEPLGIGPVVRVATDRSVDLDPLVARVRRVAGV